MDPLGSAQVSVATGFHDTYTAGGKSYTHSGLDLAADAGCTVTAPCKGKVSFVGDVPAGDSALGDASADETMLAVSIAMSDGRTVTLMPFKSASVSVGDAVGKGDVLGKLAASGDRSLSASHLHIGLKKNGVYYDPSVLLGLEVASKTSDAAEEAAGAATAGVTTTAKPKASNAASAAATEGAASASERAQGSTVSSKSESLGTITSGEAQQALPATESSEGFFEALGSLACTVSERCQEQAEGLAGGIQQLACATGIPFLVLVIAAVAMVTALLAAALHLLVRLARAKRSGAKRKITLLCGRGAGDNMHKLFPAPGTTFITRGR